MKQSKLLVGFLLATAAAASQAALPAAASASVTSIMADMQAWFDLILPAIILGVTLTIGPKLLKRFTSKI